MRNGMSIAIISRTGEIPNSWHDDSLATEQARDALYFCRDRLKDWRDIQSKLYVYRRESKQGVRGRCFWTQNMIVLRKDAPLKTLAHEVAHFAYHSHGTFHTNLSEKIFGYLENRKKK